MYIDNVSTNNFDPFSTTDFTFLGRSVTFGVGDNANRKTYTTDTC